MARLFLLALGSRGDVQPLTALGTALVGAGHEVVLATPEGFRDLVDGTRVQHVEVCPGLTPAEVLAALDPAYAIGDFDLEAETKRHPIRTRRNLLKAWSSLMERTLEEISIVGKDAEMVVWWEPVANFGRHLAQALDVPGVACGMNPENWMSSTIAVPPPTVPWPPSWLSGRARNRYIRFGHAVFCQWTNEYYRPHVNRWRQDASVCPGSPTSARRPSALRHQLCDSRR